MNKDVSNRSISEPVRYCFFMTGNDPWLRLAKELHQEGIAIPVLWLGDDRHFEGARSAFGDAVVRMNDFVHRPVDIPVANYVGEYSEFFQTKDYLDAKDICLKMMDRLDLNGTFSRIDREAYFHKLLVWALKFFYENKPDAMLMIEKPHSHAQYLIYRVAKYLGIPAGHFKDCALMPVNFLQRADGSFVQKQQATNPGLSEKFEAVVNAYVDRISALAKSDATYAPHYMVAQKNNSKLISKISKLFSKDSLPVIRDAASDIKLIFDQNYRATNPYRFLFPSREIVKFRRKRNLRKTIAQAIESANLEEKYVYFPLHYEPERTTNPDGESFHDQFKALVNLRSFLPDEMTIIVKEHPSQFLMADRGSRGRSPLFYHLIKNLTGVKLVGPEIDSFQLMRNSVAVATITGSVALESALLGRRAIVFGQAWYAGCPNTVAWEELSDFHGFVNRPVAEAEKIRTFLASLIHQYGVPMINNGGQLNAYRNQWYDDVFMTSQHEEMKSLITEFFFSARHMGVNSTQPIAK